MRHGGFREAVLVSEVCASELTCGVSDSPYAQLVGALGLKSLIRAPLVARNRTFGTMTFAISDRTYEEDDLAFANELARHAATAIDEARLYREAEAANHYLGPRGAGVRPEE
jgi:GAF domain-containing protein